MRDFWKRVWNSQVVEVCGDDGDVFCFFVLFFALSREQRGLARMCAEQRAALETLVYGGESHAKLGGSSWSCCLRGIQFMVTIHIEKG